MYSLLFSKDDPTHIHPCELPELFYYNESVVQLKNLSFVHPVPPPQQFPQHQRPLRTTIMPTTTPSPPSYLLHHLQTVAMDMRDPEGHEGPNRHTLRSIMPYEAAYGIWDMPSGFDC